MTSFDIDGIGPIEMIGQGPWRAVQVGPQLEIIDANNRVANPTIVQRFSIGTKPNRNVIFAKVADTMRIVEKANAVFAAAAPDVPAPVDGEAEG